jgi:Type IV secretory pathway, VirB11 components, and related ATPases involved in archaeal flagella biosynthesis
LGEVPQFQEFYHVDPPYASVGIKFESGYYVYEVIEPILDKEETNILERLKKGIYEEVDFSKMSKIDESEIEKQARLLMKKYKIKINEIRFKKIMYYLVRDLLRYGKITVPILDPNVEDISCDGLNVPVYIYHKRYDFIPSNIVFTDINELRSMVYRLAFKGNAQLTSSAPIVDATLPEGYRANLTLEDVSRKGPAFTIRKLFVKPITIVDLIKSRVLTPKIAAYLWIMIEYKKAILIIGTTGAGKTTTLNAIATFIPPDAKIVTIEETREINLPHKNWIPFTTRMTFQTGIKEITMFELLKASLRQRPEYIIVGEIRGEEAYTLVQAIATGHGGLTTFHAENAEFAVHRLINKPLDVPPSIINAFSVILKVEKVKLTNGLFRKVVSIDEVMGYDIKNEKPILNNIYRFSPFEEKDIDIKSSKKLIEIAVNYLGASVEEELERRSRILKWIAEKNITEFTKIGEIIAAYYRNPRRVLAIVDLNGEWI